MDFANDEQESLSYGHVLSLPDFVLRAGKSRLIYAFGELGQLRVAVLNLR